MAKEKDPSKIPLIFNATMDLVLAKGFAGLTMADVARQAGIATGTLYVYFKSKEDLIDQLYWDIKSHKSAAINASVVAGDSFYENLSRVWCGYTRHCMTEPQQMQFVLQFCDSGYISQATKDSVAAQMQPLIQLFSQAQQQKLIVDLPIPALFAHIMGSSNALVKHHVDTGEPLTDALLEMYFQMVWSSIRK